MAPALLLGANLKGGKPVPAPSLEIAASAELLGTAGDCARTAAEFLAAEIKGDHEQSDIFAGELKDSQCDVLGWSECLTTYLAYKASLSSLPYRPNLNPVMDLGQKTRIAIIGDWGTGDPVAINLLQELNNLKPEVLIHLGDVYYAGTHNEEQTNFLDLCRQVLGNNVPIFSLCGNHDMYSGGQGYYWMVDQIGQQASYFCLQNSNWRFLAMDTGHNDNNPITVASNMTKLVNFGTWSEANWILDKINLAGPNQKTVLLSHHQLFSAFGSVGKVDGHDYAYNPNLRATFQGVMSKIACWFWGHEHTLAIFDPYMGLQRGRCVGASAVPVFTDQQSYTKAGGLVTYGGLPLPTWNSQSQLGNNGESYNNCFAMMTLNGASATVDYYQVPLTKKAVKFGFSDSF
jgi:Calcineurin-like phosphoesterase